MTAITDRYRELGGEMGFLGKSTTNETTTPDGIGRYTHFLNGSIYWAPSAGAHEVSGLIRERWAELRWERGILGYPISAPYLEVRNRTTFEIALFQNGTIEVNQDTKAVHVEKSYSQASPNYWIPIVPYRMSDGDGSRACAIDNDGVHQWVNEANRVFAAAGLRFIYDGELLDWRDTEINSLTGDSDSFWASARDRISQRAVQQQSIVVVFRFGPGTNSIGGGFSWWTYDFVAMSFFDPKALGVLPHELGHFFGLPHTHGREFHTELDAVDYLLSGGSIEELDGDQSLINDTPPDPYITDINSAISIQALSLAGRPFLLSRKNIMSYWNHGGTGRLSHAQIDRVRKILLERIDRYLKVTKRMNMWQSDWRWCHKCTGLYFAAGELLIGICPAGGQHEKERSGNYSLAHNQLMEFPGQSEWRWCHKCTGLFFANGGSSAGTCPAGAQHERKSNGGMYTLTHNNESFPGQADWRWCHKCAGLFFAGGEASIGRCSAGGPHEKGASGNYTLVHAPYP